jgi:hypothetical protein
VFAVQGEIAELAGLVESLTRKNRHLADELAESSRAQEAGHSQLMSLQVGRQGAACVRGRPYCTRQCAYR